MSYYYYLSLARLRKSWSAELEGLSVPEREAAIFCRLLETLPLHIHDGDLFAGWYGYETPEEREKIYTVPPLQYVPGDPAEPVNLIRKHGYYPGDYDRAHHELDYRYLLEGGIRRVKARVEAELAKPGNDEDKINYLKGMLVALKGPEILGERYARLAESKAETADNAADKARLERIAAACRKVPMEAPEDFYEALQSAVLIRVLTCISAFTCVSVSFGSFDQYMYPYYQISKSKGISEEETITLLCQFYHLLDSYDGNDCAVSVGGVDEDDNDATNELSYLMVKAEKLSKLRAPLFVARINKNTPKEFMRELVSKELFEMGQPSFYSEENCRAAVSARGIPMEIARRFQVSTCMNLVMAKSEASHGWGCQINAHLPLELALNGGKPLVGELPYNFKTPAKTEYNSIDEIYAQYKAYAEELFSIAIDWNQKETVRQARIQPDVWLSMMTDDCIARGRDRWDGGAVYHNLIIEIMGFANASDAVNAIEELVYEQKKYTIAELLDAAKTNYEGYEEIRHDLLNAGKYGMNNASADAHARRLLDIHAEICEAAKTENRSYLPSLHTLWNDVTWGAERPAFLDGRKAGEPVCKNAGPTTIARRAGPTHLAISAGRIDQIRYNGGQALDVHIGIRNMDSPEKQDKIAAYIRTYFNMGGLQMQVNGLSVETLQKAYDNPEDYPDLLVRIGGHSRYFRDFDNDMKLRFIERFRIEEGASS
ncbi:MAG: hypothetical protein IJF78_03675 [Clostridia bacterium]|nr:hypothetical protein [Clostridia bacterium]